MSLTLVALVSGDAASAGQAWLPALLSVLAISLLSLVGAVTFIVRRDHLDHVLPYLVSVAVGAVLGVAFLHLLPDAAREGEGMTPGLGLLVLLGMVVFFVLERFIHWHQHGHAEHHAKVAPYAWLNLTGNIVHNFGDGVIIAAAYIQSPALGFTTTVAVALHEIPHELGDVGILLLGNMSRTRAVALNMLTSLVALLGAVLALLLGGRVHAFNVAAIPITAGGFIYIAAADLIPELHRERRPMASVLQVACLLLGIALMYRLV